MNEAKFAGACIIQNGEILLVQESHKEAYGLWSLPLGHVENNEKISEAAIREVKEETGYDIKLGESKELEIKGEEFKSIHKFNTDFIHLTIYEGVIKSGILKKGDDMLDAKWFPLNDFNKLPLRGDWLKFFINN
ncbi:MAG: NUDIX domain-containing protein [Candidatus Paceibacterota bacterium]|jgi:8-oxo-dGTP pyrophosphatase MutT (NUDIX family)